MGYTKVAPRRLWPGHCSHSGTFCDVLSEPSHPWTVGLLFRIIVPRCSPNVDRTGNAYHATVAASWKDGLCRNDAATVQGLYKKHFPTVRGFVLQNHGSVGDAQDVFQEAMTVLWMKAKDDTLQETTDPGAFLFRVAKNKWLDHLRSAAHKNMRVVPHEHIPDPTDAVGEDLEHRIGRLRGVYERLDAKCRTVLDRFYFERKDLATIARELGVEEESIRTIKYRCMMKLRAFRRAIEGEEGQQQR